MTTAARRVLEATGVAFDWDVQRAGATVVETAGTPLPTAVLDSVRATGVALKGPITTPVGSGFRSVNVAIRRALDLYANVRPARTQPGVPNAYPDVDLYEDIIFNDLIVDNACMQLVQRPTAYDVLVLPNLYGDIVSDLCAGLVGGLGVTPSANIGDELAVFEPVHGSAPQIAGQDKANPIAAVLSGALLLRHLGEIEAATRVEDGVASVLAAGEALTFDLQPTSPVGTRAMTDAIIAML